MSDCSERLTNDLLLYADVVGVQLANPKQSASPSNEWFGPSVAGKWKPSDLGTFFLLMNHAHQHRGDMIIVQGGTTTQEPGLTVLQVEASALFVPQCYHN